MKDLIEIPIIFGACFLVSYLFVWWFTARDEKDRQKRLTLELPFLTELLQLEVPWGKIHFDKIKPIIEEMEREGKSFAPHIKSEEDKRACVDELEKIIRCAEIEVSVESKLNQTDHKRKNDYERFIPLAESQKGRVKAWRGHIHYTEQISFEALSGGAEITRNGEDEATAFAVMLPSGAYRVTIDKNEREMMSEESKGEGRYDFVKAGIGAIRNGQAIIEDLHTGQRERVPFW